eukprot:GHVL01018516.1.p1 GENE.GHVL01018516.1~~GHVL01018516.1.p1  ORF type:complete len:320 (+),score=28.21 GHVL01018516.1:119-1078(+)
MYLVQPKNECWVKLGHCYNKLNETNKSFEAYQTALNININDADLWYGIALLYVKMRSFVNAEHAMTAILKLTTEKWRRREIYWRLAVLYQQMQKYTKSYMLLNTLLLSPPREIMQKDVAIQIIQTLGWKTDFKSAVEHMYSIFPSLFKQTDKDCCQLYLYLAAMLIRENQSSFALNFIENINEREFSLQEDSSWWYLYGKACLGVNDLINAREAFQMSIDKDPENCLSWCSLAILSYQTAQAIKLNDCMGEAWFNLGILCQYSKRPQESRLAYTKAFNLSWKIMKIYEGSHGLPTPLQPVELKIDPVQPPNISVKYDLN